MKEKLSKRILTLISIVSLMLLIVMIVVTGACAKPAPAPAPAPSPATSPAPAPAPAKPITLVFSYFEPPQSIYWVKLFKPWFDEVENLTEGRVKVEAHLAGELASLLEAYDATVRGAVDMAFVFPMMHPEIFPMQDIGTMCSHDVYGTNYSRIIWELYGTFPEMVAEYTNSGTKVIWAGLNDTCGVVSTKKAGPIRTIADMKGLKATCTGKAAGDRQEALGLVSVSLPPEECVMSFKTGVLDCGCCSTYLLRDMGWGPVTSYLTVPVQYTQGVLAIVINLDTWNSFPDDVKKIWEETGEANIDVWDELALQANIEGIASATKDFGTEVIEFPKEELAKAAALDKPVREAWAAELEAKGLPGKKLLDEFLRLEQKYSLPENPFM